MGRLSTKYWLRNEQGSFTIEASLVYPFIFLCTIGVIFFSLWSYEKAYLLHKSAITADRTAYNWDNSFKNPETGAYDIRQNDDLYFRIHNDGLGQSLAINLPNDLNVVGLSGPRLKLHNSAVDLPNGLKGRLTFRNRLIDRRVQVQLSRMINPLPFLQQWFGYTKLLSVSSSSLILDPAEFVRNTELVTTYLPLIKQSMTDKEVEEIIDDKGVNDEPALELAIKSEAEASTYIRDLVHGRSVVFDTETTGESRKIDALDPDGIAHEAKYTVNNKQAHQEILKDVELMQRGVIKGAVWHFFKLQKTGQTGLTPALRRDLEEHGIIIVIHN